MKMISTARRQNSLSLSGGHIVSDQLSMPSYSPNAMSPIAQTFPWDDAVDDMNTPDIDPSFFDNGPFFAKKYNSQDSLQMDIIGDENIFLNTADQTIYTAAEDVSQQSIHPSLEDNFDLSSLINQTTVETNKSSMVSPNDVLENTYIPLTTAPVLHYLEARPVESIASTVNIDFITNTSLIDSLNSQSTVESYSQFSSPTHTSQSYSPAMSSVTQTYISPTPSPALSYASTPVSVIDAITSDSTTTIDSLIESKPDTDFLQPTVINDHLYTLPSKPNRKRRKSSEKPMTREKNSETSKKTRVTKRDKQKMMEEKIRHYEEDNKKCGEMIERMEREIKWCKEYLFKKVVASAQT